MATKRISVSVRPDGTVAATTHGIQGPGCLDEVARIEKLTGATTSDSQLTADFHASSSQVEVQAAERVVEEGWA